MRTDELLEMIDEEIDGIYKLRISSIEIMAVIDSLNRIKKKVIELGEDSV